VTRSITVSFKYINVHPVISKSLRFIDIYLSTKKQINVQVFLKKKKKKKKKPHLHQTILGELHLRIPNFDHF
jgi:hypothetical protein